jgi:hypothetical protein
MGTGPWYWTCSGTNNGSISTCSAVSGTPVATGTKAKVFLETDDSFIVSSSGTTLYGGSGVDVVTITAGVTNVILDQNIERINLSGTSDSYQFKQSGNKIAIYDTAGTTLLVTAPAQGDSDGTVLSFSNGVASVVLSGGVMKLGGSLLSSTVSSLSPTITVDTPPATTATRAKVYLGTDDTFIVSSSGTTVYGGAGSDVVTITAGVSGVILDQNIERINLSGAVSSYSFTQTGNKLNIYDTTGVTRIVTVPVQGDGDGTILSFSDGKTSALLSGGVITVGGAMVR